MKSWLQSFPAFWAYCTGKVLLSQTQQPCGGSFLGPRVQRAETLLTNGEAKGHVGLSGALPMQAGRYLARFHTLATREAREEGGVGGVSLQYFSSSMYLSNFEFPSEIPLLPVLTLVNRSMCFMHKHSFLTFRVQMNTGSLDWDVATRNTCSSCFQIMFPNNASGSLADCVLLGEATNCTRT